MMNCHRLWRVDKRGRSKPNVFLQDSETYDKNGKGERKSYPIIKRENENFEKYYKLQKICPEEQWDEFMTCLRTGLPVSFRVTGSRSRAIALNYIVEHKMIRDALVADSQDKESDHHVKALRLPWYPDGLGWQINLTRNDIRRVEAYYRLQNFLISETDSGNISRQEAVSMIPPLALKVEPHHKVLDMCAAPGSKTAQMIEMLHSDDEGVIPEGFLIANDVDNKRCYMLIHQTKRLQSPAVIITNHDAAIYPDVLCSDPETPDKKIGLKFDRILCDVPCSGDGTMRKNLDLWKNWNPSNAMFLSQIQYRILKRGLELLAVDGHLVYSTCSLNPIENESIIYRILKSAEGAVELMDIDLKNLNHIPGVSHWIPTTKDMVSYNSHAEVPKEWLSMLRDYHFPPSPEDAPKYNLDKCIRVLPHHQDTGGFFIALLKKTRPLPWEKETVVEEKECNEVVEEEKEVTQKDVKTGGPPRKVRRIGHKEDPFVFLKADDNTMFPPIKEFFGLDSGIDTSLLLTRSVEGRRKNIYLTNNLVRDVVINNEHRLKIINTGVRAFARSETKWVGCEYRLAHEGLQCLLPHVHKRRITILKEDIITLLSNNDEAKPPLISEFSEETQNQVNALDPGSFVIQLENCQTYEEGPSFNLEIIGFKGNASIRAYVSPSERIHYLRLCGGDTSQFEKNKYEEARKIAAAEEENGVLEVEAVPTSTSVDLDVNEIVDLSGEQISSNS